LIDIVKCKPSWTSENVVDNKFINIKSQVENKRVICGLSGGVDSAIAAALVQKAISNHDKLQFWDLFSQHDVYSHTIS